MAKNMLKNPIVWIIAAVAIYFIATGGITGSQSILPSGQYTAWPSEGVCTFTTNIDNINSGYSEFGDSSIWINILVGSSKEAYGYASPTSSTTTRLNACGRSSSAVLLSENFAADGSDMYKYQGALYVCDSNGNYAKRFYKDYGAASNAVDCSGGTQPVCGNGQYESGETQSNCPADCGTSGPVCGNGVCETGETPSSCSADCQSSSCTMDNVIAQGPISRNDLGKAIQSWTNS